MKNTLIISPHGDDECLSTFTYLLKSKDNQINLYVIYQAVNEQKRIDTIKKISVDFEFTYDIAFPGFDSRMDKLSMQEIVSYYDNQINKKEWDEIIIPSKSFHQDHQICNNACIATLRRNKISSIYISEHPFHISYFTTNFTSNKYIPFNNIDEKITYLNRYKPYIKDDDVEMMKQLNKFRGNQIGYKYAEAFEVIREIN